MRFRQFCLASLSIVGLSLGLAQFASAADMPVKGVSRAVYAPVYNWTGLYLGINGGYGWGTQTGNFVPSAGVANPTLRGGLFGGQIGVNYQITNWVFGIEADYDWASIKGSVTPIPGAVFDGKTNAFGTVRGRLGYACGISAATKRASFSGSFGGTILTCCLSCSAMTGRNHGNRTMRQAWAADGAENQLYASPQSEARPTSDLRGEHVRQTGRPLAK